MTNFGLILVIFCCFGLFLVIFGYFELFLDIFGYFELFLVIFEPIKTKTAAEIAERMWKFISMWGPPKVIFSDQGTEFNNQLLNALMKTVGVERRISSGYHPRTSGLVERFNHCFVEALKGD